jgi:predicted ATP-grasp superfamily ATP-dependent carboligase
LKLMPGRILVTDAQERSVVAAIRCLGDAGFEVTALASSWTAPGLWSRAPALRRLGPDPRRDIDGFIQRVEQLLQERRHDAVLAGTDAALFAISRHRERLIPHARLGLPDDEIVVATLDRVRLGSAARAVGLAAPDELRCAGPGDALEAAASFGYPVLVKPVHTVIQHRGAVDRRGSVLADDQAELCVAARSFEECIVQRRIAGDVISFGGVSNDAGLFGFVVSRYSRTWPPRAGNASFAETIQAPDGLADRIDALVAQLGWIGLFEVELIACEDGRLATIDFNPRAYGSMSIATAAGVPLAALWCGWLLGHRPPRPAAAPAGIRYRWGEADISNALWQLRRGARVSSLEAIRPRTRVTHPYLRLSDPAPAAARAIELALKTWNAQTHRRGRAPSSVSSETAVPQRSSAP